LYISRRIFCLVLGVLWLIAAPPSGAQQGPDMPVAVCEAIEEYVAQINSAAANKNKVSRQEQYSAALNMLSAALKQHNKESLLKPAKDFTDSTELVVCCDPSNAKYGELVKNRLNAGSALQKICMPYTTSR
jgi:hypothetical protein